MTYVITEDCIGCKFAYCAGVCPVDAFHEGKERLYINPEACIDCNACVSECPVEAIYADVDVPAQFIQSIDENASEAEKYPVLKASDPLPPPLKSPSCKDPNAG